MSPFIAAVARARMASASHTLQRQVRPFATTKAVPPRAPAEWGAQWRKVGGSALMYFPVVAVVMFWPYAVKPIMDAVEERR